MFKSFSNARGISLAVLVASVGLAALAANAKSGAKTLHCTFEAGAAWTYTGGKFEPQKLHRLAFAIADVDMHAQTAKLVTDNGETQLKTVQAVNARHFIEVASAGFLNLTTVYDKDEATGLLPAVHSRHFGVLGQALVSQYRGSCREKD